MRAYADTSFIAALYHPEEKTREAVAYMSNRQEPLILTEVQHAETRNSFRLRVAHKRSSSEEVFRALAQFDRDITDEIFTLVSTDWPRTFREVEKIGRKFTEQGGRRFADILHVASARILETRAFLTFDQRQARLARALGMKTPL